MNERYENREVGSVKESTHLFTTWVGYYGPENGGPSMERYEKHIELARQLANEGAATLDSIALYVTNGPITVMKKDPDTQERKPVIKNYAYVAEIAWGIADSVGLNDTIAAIQDRLTRKDGQALVADGAEMKGESLPPEGVNWNLLPESHITRQWTINNPVDF